MAKRRRSSDADIIALLITIPLVIIYWFLIEGYKYLVWFGKLCINGLVNHYVLIYSLLSKKNKHYNKNDNIEFNHINIKTKYDSLFPSIIRDRGIDYYTKGNVIDFKYDDNHVNAKVFGTHIYNSHIYFNSDGTIKTVSCTCPYYFKDGRYCKHLYALLLKVDCISETNTNKESLIKYSEPVVEDYDTYGDYDDYDDIDEYDDNDDYDDNEYEGRDLNSFWGLSNEEANEVKKGNYSPWNFEEEDLEEDDYYYEDDN